MVIKQISKPTKHRPWSLYKATLTLKDGTRFEVESICRNAAKEAIYRQVSEHYKE